MSLRRGGSKDSGSLRRGGSKDSGSEDGSSGGKNDANVIFIVQ